MPINEVATQKVFKGLTCAYTGKPVTVRVIAANGASPLFFSPDAFDPSVPMGTVKALLEAAGTRNGIMGALSSGAELTCPYSGSRMSISRDDEGARLVGGFRPSRPVPGADMFNHLMRMRGGVATTAAPDTKGRITFNAADDTPAVKRASGKPKDVSLEYAEEVLSPLAPKRVSVSVPGAVPKRRKG